MNFPAPIVCSDRFVDAAWIDHHGHMNVGYYSVVIDLALTDFTNLIGMGKEYRDRTNQGFFAIETHQTFQKELREGERFRVEVQLIDWNYKLAHVMTTLIHSESNELSATAEFLWVHVDRAARKSIPFPEEAVKIFEALERSHKDLTPPIQPGLGISIKK